MPLARSLFRLSRLIATPVAALVAVLVAVLVVALPVGATWSIVAIDRRTGEVVSASATCIVGDDLERFVPVVLVGKGAAASQSAVDILGRNKLIIFDGFQKGQTAQTILERCRDEGPGAFQTRQFGIVTPDGIAKSFTGGANGAAALGVRGRDGTVKYAIQGNVLAGDDVVFEAERAFLETEGDLTLRVMAAMEAARAQGGDGRCSCDDFAADSCGTPPPGFTKSAHVGYVIVGRRGDVDGICTADTGCATGEYFMNLEVVGLFDDPDPVLVLQQLYSDWRAGKLGRPDHHESTARLAAQSVPADGRTCTSMKVQLVDIDGTPIPSGGATLTVQLDADGARRAEVTGIHDHGDGSYTIDVRARDEPGRVVLDVRVDDGLVQATLAPPPILRVDRPEPLHCGFDEVAFPSDASVPFVVNVPAGKNAPYVILGSTSGTSPGQPLSGGLNLPLNKDPFFVQSLLGGDAAFAGLRGVLDETGRAQGAFVGPARALLELVGLRLDWTALVLADELIVTNTAGFDVVLSEAADPEQLER